MESRSTVLTSAEQVARIEKHWNDRFNDEKQALEALREEALSSVIEETARDEINRLVDALKKAEEDKVRHALVALGKVQANDEETMKLFHQIIEEPEEGIEVVVNSFLHNKMQQNYQKNFSFSSLGTAITDLFTTFRTTFTGALNPQEQTYKRVANGIILGVGALVVAGAVATAVFASPIAGVGVLLAVPLIERAGRIGMNAFSYARSNRAARRLKASRALIQGNRNIAASTKQKLLKKADKSIGDYEHHLAVKKQKMKYFTKTFVASLVIAAGIIAAPFTSGVTAVAVAAAVGYVLKLRTDFQNELDALSAKELQEAVSGYQVKDDKSANDEAPTSSTRPNHGVDAATNTDKPELVDRAVNTGTANPNYSDDELSAANNSEESEERTTSSHFFRPHSNTDTHDSSTAMDDLKPPAK